ncbi:hypothetical protein [Bowmanella sp. JS7-9]|uniref:DoxX-like family protein n=1 Tax=Pseudobowmanella zhangzhouensis TaxID=1537679 RepID=A0ABW1XIS3_9ALTE|nr:hypothetical protein [Bowmanella sp. JS7-9]TBX21426.1 hypothetical protein TK45_12845 [Bowmanella sp. JS7-9]
MIEAFKHMPLLLKLITGHAAICILFLLKATIPGFMGDFSYRGQVMGYQEIWGNDLGVWLILIGAFFPIAGLLLVLRWKYSRQYYSLVLLCVFIIPTTSKGDFVYLPLALFVPSLIIAYLFKSKKVREYYGT